MKRENNIEFVRIIACFLVVIIHVHIYNYQILNILFLDGVPLFALITGYCFFNKERNYKQVLKKSFSKIIIPIFFLITFLSIFREFIFNNSTILECIKNFNLIKLLKSQFSILVFDFFGVEELTGIFWYLRFYFSVILAYPIFKNICSNKQESKLLRHILIIILIVAIIFKDLRTLNIIEYTPITIFNYLITVYIFLGYEIKQNQKELINLKPKSFILAIFLIIIGLMLRFKISIIGPINYYTELDTTPFLLTSVGLFILLANIGLLFKKEKLIRFISDKTLGIYLVHYAIIKFIIYHNIIDIEELYKLDRLELVIYELIYGTIIFIISLIIVTIIKKIIQLIKEHKKKRI